MTKRYILRHEYADTTLSEAIGEGYGSKREAIRIANIIAKDPVHTDIVRFWVDDTVKDIGIWSKTAIPAVEQAA